MDDKPNKLWNDAIMNFTTFHSIQAKFILFIN